MILGIGTDIIEIDRIKKAIKSENFLRKIFTNIEIEKFKNKPESLSGNFTVKEAIVKAFGTGFSEISPRDIEVLRDKKGMPFVNLYKKALEVSKQNNVSKIHVSISHNISTAIAYVIIEKDF